MEDDCIGAFASHFKLLSTSGRAITLAPRSALPRFFALRDSADVVRVDLYEGTLFFSKASEKSSLPLSPGPSSAWSMQLYSETAGVVFRLPALFTSLWVSDLPLGTLFEVHVVVERA